jgi:hypothetical protein
MLTTNFYPSKYMKASTFDCPVIAVIAGFEAHKMNDGSTKPALIFEDGELPGLTLNKMNLHALQLALGFEYRDAVLFVTPEFNSWRSEECN